MDTHKFQFLFPLIDENDTHAKHFTDVVVTATATIGREQQLLEVRMNSIVYFNPSDNSRDGQQIHSLLWVVNKKLYLMICEAAKQHAITKYKIKKPQQQISSHKKQLQQ